MKKTIIKKALSWAYVEFIYPEAKKYVKSTTNKYDDQALEFLNNLVKDLLKKI
jgi:hypothetical protein